MEMNIVKIGVVETEEGTLYAFSVKEWWGSVPYHNKRIYTGLVNKKICNDEDIFSVYANRKSEEWENAFNNQWGSRTGSCGLEASDAQQLVENAIAVIGSEHGRDFGKGSGVYCGSPQHTNCRYLGILHAFLKDCNTWDYAMFCNPVPMRDDYGRVYLIPGMTPDKRTELKKQVENLINKFNLL